MPTVFVKKVKVTVKQYCSQRRGCEVIKHLGENIFACNLLAITCVSYEAHTKCVNGQKWHLSSHKFPTGTEIWYSVLTFN